MAAFSDLNSLVEVLRIRSEQTPDRVVFSYLVEGERVGRTVTYRELHERACAIAARLQRHLKKGDRALLLYAQGIEYIEAFFGCLYAGVIAVPAYPPDPSRLGKTLPRLIKVMRDCKPSIVLTTSDLSLKTRLLSFRSLTLARSRWLSTDEVQISEKRDYQAPKVSGDDIAFLQYTSGSTGNPKGVMVSHRNLIHNCETIKVSSNYTENEKVVTWLPLYHDMGLIGHVLLPVYAGAQSRIMSPIDFLKHPYRWLKAISDYQATITGAPNFALEFAASKISPDLIERLDLSPLRIIACGAEPIRAATFENFLKAFSKGGIRSDVLWPCYGLAEATLFVSGADRSQMYRQERFDLDALKSGRGEKKAPTSNAQEITLVSSGRIHCSDFKVLIVDPNTRKVCPSGKVGEVWIQCESVALGYWEKPDLSREIFQAKLAGSASDSNESGSFLRTGDLAFWQGDQLYITGRSKDLIIVNGQNHYPSDLESTVGKTHSSIRRGCAIAFSYEKGGTEHVVIVAEIKGSARGNAWSESELEGIRRQVRSIIFKDHALAVHEVVLIRPGTIPKTTSGKLQRSAAKEAYFKGELSRISAKSSRALSSYLKPLGRRKRKSVSEVRDRLVALIARELEVDPSRLDPRLPLGAQGLTSVKAVSLSATISKEFSVDFPVTWIWHYPTIEKISSKLISLSGNTKSAVTSEAPRSDLAHHKSEIEGSRAAAIVGIACRLPGARNTQEFWKLLTEGRCGIRSLPSGRWDLSALDSSDREYLEKGGYTRGGYIDDVECFDSLFFGISPREAKLMDPQQRILLETVWEALEDAGIRPSELSGKKIGVFVGASSSDYAELLNQNVQKLDLQITTGNSHSILANRISYFFNLSGPSLTLDTACSSSAVAMHEAMRALRAGDCEMAIVAGVNLMLTPSVSLAFAKAGMLSRDGLCYTFDHRANGYVRGEGVGVVVLKRFSDVQAGDPVYAKVLGSAVNHCGRTHSLTAPNPNAQAELIRSACLDAQVPVGSLGYIEAHGTATPLGDPIELSAIQVALSNVENCVIGSVKSNIGHLEAAAGIAGIIKTALAIKNRQIPSSLHFERLNPKITLSGTKIKIGSQTQSWPEHSVSGSRIRAGVSSFGFGGTNCHIVLEAADSTQQLKSERQSKSANHSVQAILLSAKSQKSLRALIACYIEYLSRPEIIREVSIEQIALSTQNHREHFDYRLCFLASSLPELSQQMGSLKRLSTLPDQPLIGKESVEPRLRETIEKWLAGSEIDWKGLFGNIQSSSTALFLPTYPFEKARHWIVEKTSRPMMDGCLENSPTRKRFEKTLRSDEFFIQDHGVAGQMILPGVGYLELLSEAVSLGFSGFQLSQVSDLYWLRPIAVSRSEVKVWVELNRRVGQADGFDFEIYTLDWEEQKLLHCKGSLHVAPVASFQKAAVQSSSLDGRPSKVRNWQEIYDEFKRLGFQYGPTFRCMQVLRTGKDQAQSTLELPEGLRASATHFDFHPSLMDAALGTCIGIEDLMEGSKDGEVFVPFGLKKLAIHAKVQGKCTAKATISSTPINDPDVREFDVEIFSEDGSLAVAFIGVSVRKMKLSVLSKPMASMQYWTAHWEPEALTSASGSQLMSASILWIEQGPSLDLCQRDSVFEWIRQAYAQGRLHKHVAIKCDRLRREECVVAHLHLYQAIRSVCPTDEVRVISYRLQSHNADFESSAHEAVGGFARSIVSIDPSYSLKVVQFEGEASSISDIQKNLSAEFELDQFSLELEVRYIDATREVRRFSPIPPRDVTVPSSSSSSTQGVSIRKGGVYLITGGTGKLGKIFGLEIARMGAGAVILMGRRCPSSNEVTECAQEFETFGTKILFECADVSDKDALQRAWARIRNEFGAIHGVIHASGTASSVDVRKATRESYLNVLNPKISGTLALDLASAEEKLDFFMLVSSISSWLGDYGAGDYASANRFLDAFAQKRNRLVEQGQRMGATLCVNWPYWELGGMSLSVEALERARQALGIVPMPTTVGISAFADILSWSPEQVTVFYGDQGLIKRRLQRKPTRTILSSAAQINQSGAAVNPNTDSESVREFLAESLSRCLGIERQEIQPDRDIREYGVDSLMAMELLDQVRKKYGDVITTSDLFQKPRIADLSALIHERSAAARGSATGTVNANVPQVSKSSTETRAIVPITPVSNIFPLSHGQKAMWFLHQMDPSIHAYNIPIGIRILSEVNVPAMLWALRQFVQRHEILRATVIRDGAGPNHEIHENSGVDFKVVDMKSESWDAIRKRAILDAREPFDLESGPMLCVTLYQRHAAELLLVINAHHLIFDGLSVAIAARQVLELYRARCAGSRTHELKSFKPYREFVSWQEKFVESESGRKSFEFWKNRLNGHLSNLELQTDRPRPSVKSHHGAGLNFEIDAGLAKRLRDLAKSRKVTVYSVLLAAFFAFLRKYSGQQNIVIGTPALGRTEPGFEDTIGYFVNMLVLQQTIHPELTVDVFLKQIQSEVQQALEHQDYPFPLLVEKLNVTRDPSRSPIFDVCFVYQGMLKEGIFRGDGPFRYEHLDQQEGQFDIELELMEKGDQSIEGHFKYNTDLFDRSTIERWSRAYLGILKLLTSMDDRMTVTDLYALDPEERKSILIHFNRTERVYSGPMMLHQRFAEQVEKSPLNVALQFRDQSWTYKELAEKTSKLAHWLKRQGVEPDSPVGLFTERSLEMVLGIYGTIQSGGAYMPLEPSYPESRLRYMIEDARPRVILTQRRLRAMLESLVPKGVVILVLDDPHAEWTQMETSPVESAVHADHLAYILYTSGSTGRPKGVGVPHRGICNRLLWMQEYLDLKPSDRVLQKTPFSFDVSVWEFFWPLQVGATLVIAEPDGHKDPAYLVEVICRDQITTLHFVPSMLEIFLENPSTSRCLSLRTVVCSGEALTASQRNRFFEVFPEGRLHNLYGPTEASVDVTFWECRKSDQDTVVPIGRPIANTQIYILDERLRPVPLGIAGEICIGGVGLARGYINQPVLTREKFVRNPFDSNSRLYRTGDLGRYRPDGNIEYLGRLDHQVKIRGFRIELGEIENVLARHPSVQRVVVLANESKGSKAGDRSLVAYVVARESKDLTASLRSLAASELAEYMVPSLFVEVPEIPLSENGKIDRKKLIALAEASTSTQMEMNSVGRKLESPTEISIADVWRKLLKTERVDADSNFFSLGGNSLLCVRTILEINQILGTKLSVRDLYENQTVASLAAKVEGQTGSKDLTGSTVDLEREVSRYPSLSFKAPSPLTYGGHESVLLTGASGFFGAYLLRDLLETTEHRIYCLVRAQDATSGSQRVRDNLSKYGLWKDAYARRIVAVPGDMGKPRLGIQNEQYEYLSGKVGIVFHNAAKVNFLQPYAMLKSENVDGTQSILEFCGKTAIKRLHYVSTVSVFASSKYDRESYLTEEAVPYAQGIIGGYAQSKWVAEQLVLKAIAGGLRGWVYRLGTIAGDSNTGACNESDLLPKLLVGAIELGSMPKMDRKVEFSPVNLASRAMVAISKLEDSHRSIFHLVHPSPPTQSELAKMIQKLEYPLKEVELKEWTQRLIAEPENSIADLVPLFTEVLPEIGLTQAEYSEKQPKVRCPETLKVLNSLSLAYPKIGIDLLETYLNQLLGKRERRRHDIA
jgi:amino acid adenylation domain-containing protein/thioester reductase-like protein